MAVSRAPSAAAMIEGSISRHPRVGWHPLSLAAHSIVVVVAQFREFSFDGSQFGNQPKSELRLHHTHTLVVRANNPVTGTPGAWRFRLAELPLFVF